MPMFLLNLYDLLGIRRCKLSIVTEWFFFVLFYLVNQFSQVNWKKYFPRNESKFSGQIHNKAQLSKTQSDPSSIPKNDLD